MQSYTRRQLKEDKFAKGAQEAAHWAVAHRPLLIWGIASLAVVAIAVFGFITWNSRQSQRANVDLSKAIETLSAPLRPAGSPADPTDPTAKSFTSSVERGKEAEKELKAIADQYPYTKPGKIAAYMAGTAAIQAGDTASGEQQLKTMADSGDKSVAALAKLALADYYSTSNHPAEAAKIYKDLTDHPTDTVSKGVAQLHLAEMYQDTNPKEAASLYQQIQKDNPKSVEAQIAGSKLNSNK